MNIENLATVPASKGTVGKQIESSEELTSTATTQSSSSVPNRRRTWLNAVVVIGDTIAAVCYASEFMEHHVPQAAALAAVYAAFAAIHARH